MNAHSTRLPSECESWNEGGESVQSSRFEIASVRSLTQILAVASDCKLHQIASEQKVERQIQSRLQAHPKQELEFVDTLKPRKV